MSEYIGRGDGGFYVEQPDIPEGLTCQEWRVRRFEIRTAERPEPAGRPKRAERPQRAERARLRRRSIGWRVPRPRFA